MNSQIKDKHLKTDSDEGKNHQAYFMELSRLKKAKKNCEENEECDDYLILGGNNRYNEIEPLVKRAQDINHAKKKIAMDTGAQNQFQKPLKGTEVGVPNVTKGSDHSGSSTLDKIIGNKEKNSVSKTKETQAKIMSNSQALSEEISKMKYLIRYMDNNNKKQIL